MNVKLTPEQERIVETELRAGHFRTVEELIGKALQILQDNSSPLASDNGERRAAVSEMLRFAEKNRTPLHGVSVKQLIHEGHRL